MHYLSGLSKWIVTNLARFASWLNLALILLICTDVLLRYVLNETEAWILELEWHLFAAVFLLGAASTYKEDQHVRVDVFYSRFSPSRKAWVNLLGNIVLLLPFLFIAIRASWSYAAYSFQIGEGSPDPGGLPARYIIKFVLPLSLIILAIQCITFIISDIRFIMDRKPARN